MKIELPNKAGTLYLGALTIGCIITGLLLSEKKDTATAAGIAGAITFVIAVFGISTWLFPSPHVRARNITRIILIGTLFHIVPIIFTSGLLGIAPLCGTDHPAKISESMQKAYSSVKIPLVGIKNASARVLGKITKTPKKESSTAKSNTRKKQTKESSGNFFSYVYLVFFASIMICLYKIFFSWGGSAFLCGILTLALLLVYFHWIWSCEIHWKAIGSIIFLAPFGMTIFFGKEFHTNPATN